MSKDLAPGPLQTIRALRARAGQLEAKAARLEEEGEALRDFISRQSEQMSLLKARISMLESRLSEANERYVALCEEHEREQAIADEIIEAIYQQAALLNRMAIRRTEITKIIESERVATLVMEALEKFKRHREGQIA